MFILKALHKLLRAGLVPLSSLLVYGGVLGIIGIGIPVTIDVLGRFFFSSPLPGTIEINEIMMCVVSVSALAFIQVKDRHINVEIFYDKFSPWWKSLADMICGGTGTVVVGIVAWQSLLYALKKLSGMEATETLGIPTWSIALYVAVCLIIFTFTLVDALLEKIICALDCRRYGAVAIALAACVLVYFFPDFCRTAGLASNKPLMGGLCMIWMFIMLVLGMPIGLAMMTAGLQGLLVILPRSIMAMNMAGMTAYTTSCSYVLTVIPMFVLMGELALLAGISTLLFRSADVWLGRLPGGLAIATLGGCAGFAAVCGDSLATAASMTSVALPEMRRKGYDPALACATLSCGGTLGILIPPSMGFIYYSLITEVSVGRLFMAGVIPGILLTVVLMCLVYVIARMRPDLAPRGDKTTLKEKISAIRGIFPMMGLVTLIMGGMLTGVCTPTEGGAIGAVGTLCYGLLLRRVKKQTLLAALQASNLITSKVCLILIGVGILGYFLAASNMPTTLSEMAVSMGTNRYVVLALIIALLLILGCMMNVVPMILLVMPSLFPVAFALGFDPVWFGVITVIIMEIGQLTPPVGVIVFAVAGIAQDVPLMLIFKRLMPIYLAMLGVILVLIIFPSLATWLPDLLFNK